MLSTTLQTMIRRGKFSSAPLLLPYFSLLIGIFSLGFSAIFIRWAQAPGIVTSFYRMAIATIVMAIPFLSKNFHKNNLIRKSIAIAVLGGLFFAADLSLWSSGVVMSGATNPTLLANTAPLWVGLGALLIFKEKLPGNFWIGLFLSLVGAAIILGEDSLSGLNLGFGTFLGLSAGIFYGGYYLITQKGRQHLDSLSYFWISCASSSVFLYLLSVLMGYPLSGYPANTVLQFFLMAFVTQVIGYLSINYALGHLPATAVSVTMLGQPVMTALIAGPLLGEFIQGFQFAGGILVLAGVYLVHKTQHRNGQRHIPPTK